MKKVLVFCLIALAAVLLLVSCGEKCVGGGKSNDPGNCYIKMADSENYYVSTYKDCADVCAANQAYKSSLVKAFSCNCN